MGKCHQDLGLFNIFLSKSKILHESKSWEGKEKKQNEAGYWIVSILSIVSYCIYSVTLLGKSLLFHHSAPNHLHSISPAECPAVTYLYCHSCAQQTAPLSLAWAQLGHDSRTATLGGWRAWGEKWSQQASRSSQLLLFGSWGVWMRYWFPRTKTDL